MRGGEPDRPRSVFKACTCGHAWETRDNFLEDPDVELVGYQVRFEELELGLFLFNHLVCLSTTALEAAAFTDLYRGPIYSRPLTGEEACPGYCLREEELRRCPAECECAYVREVLQLLLAWPKRERGGARRRP